MLDFTTLGLGCLAAFLAGFVDAVVGGGGLVQVPALFILLPGYAPAVVLGTNKISSVAGTGVAMLRYARRLDLNWRLLLPMAFFAWLASWGGASLVIFFDPELFKPIVLLLLVAVAGYTWRRHDLGAVHLPKLFGGRSLRAGVAVALLLGFYDGFFGPGTGSFLIFCFVGLFGYSFINASASAKVINFTTNLAAVVYFTAHGAVLWELGIPMALANIAGAALGVRTAFLRGNRFVRGLFLTVIIAILARFSWDVLMRPG